jgi:hypothetical protein
MAHCFSQRDTNVASTCTHLKQNFVRMYVLAVETHFLASDLYLVILQLSAFPLSFSVKFD